MGSFERKAIGRLYKIANMRLATAKWLTDFPPETLVGRHLALVCAARTAEAYDPGERARWLIHWMIGYLRSNSYIPSELSTSDGRAAVEAAIEVAVLAKTRHPNQAIGSPKLNGTPWREVYDAAQRMVDQLINVVRV